MEIKPIKLKKKPEYPTIDTFIDHPQLFSKSIPHSWLKNRAAVTAVTSFIVIGCYNQAKSIRPKTEFIANANQFSKGTNLEIIQNIKQDSVKVARIFSHGDGSGAIGCVVESPPVFISEDEARNIIFTALKAENIIFDTTAGPTLKFNAEPIANDCPDDDSIHHTKAKVHFKLDGYNAEYNLAIGFVSARTYQKFRSADYNCYSTLGGVHTKRAAELIREELNANGKINAAVFYDPLPQLNLNRKEKSGKAYNEARLKAREQLLAQVADFIDWIKKEGIIRK